MPMVEVEKWGRIGFVEKKNFKIEGDFKSKPLR